MMHRSFCLLCALLFSITAYANWFSDTPLSRTYEALLNGQPLLAWQELHLALSQQNISRDYWQPVKLEILNQTQCGQKLITHSEFLPANISLSFVRRSGLASQGFQIKLSAEDVHSTLDVELTSPTKKRILHGLFTSQLGYQEMESEEMLVEPESGVYQLKLNENTYALIIAMPKNQNWLTLDNITQQLTVTPPTVTDSCAKAMAHWQWFDRHYTLIDKRIPIQTLNAPFPKSSQQPKGAAHLSASVSIFEYQQGLKVEYIQRLALPFSASQ
ncbi:DUF2861 family protein [Vibrio sp. Isolate23]|uniref:DUF2861 family protein n=1 Tax=Vibrio sp. Isolate23 TaxID=2908533 RepID=UPI001EFDEAC9|nr:DUF2861 family protein [Vibrio sp. Isolate23]MCG9681997.1 DUF2861 family protein [Vibrio sp. Isolate23]